MTEESLIKAVESAIKQQVAVIIDEEAKLAGIAVEKRVRLEVVRIAAILTNQMSLSARGPELTITIRFDEMKKFNKPTLST